MSDPSLIADLIRSGLDPELVGRVANALMEAAKSGNSGGIPVDKTAEKRRAYDRERKRNSGGIPVESGGIPNSAISLKKEELKEVKKERKRGAEIPVEWKPSEKHYSDGYSLGLSRREVDEHATDMRLWAESNKHRDVARKADWDKTFLAWMRRNSKGKPRPPDPKNPAGQPQPPHPGLPSDAELRAKYGQRNATSSPPAAESSSAGEDNPRKILREGADVHSADGGASVRSTPRVTGVRSLGSVLSGSPELEAALSRARKAREEHDNANPVAGVV